MSRAKRIQPPDVFRGLADDDSIESVYLYGDGHVIVTFSRWISDVSKHVRYAKQARTLGIRVHLYDAACEEVQGGKGRIVFSATSVPMLRVFLAAGASRLEGFAIRQRPSGGEVGSLDFETPFGFVTMQRTDSVNPGVYVDPDYGPDLWDPSNHAFGEMRIVETILKDAA